MTTEIPISPPSNYTVVNGEMFPTMISSETLLFLRSRFYSRRVEIESCLPKSSFPLRVIDISESVVESVISDGFINIAPYSCNGLCFSYRDGGDGLVWNARSGEHVKVAFSTYVFSTYVPPAIVNNRYDNYLPKLCFAGLGFDYRSGDYKVIAFVDHLFTAGGYPIGGVISVVLYSLKSNSWKHLICDDVNSANMPNELDGGVVYKYGVLHWMRGDSIYAFNFATECFSSYITLPECLALQLVDFRGDLGVVAFKNENETKTYELWRVINDGWAWDIQIRFTVDLDTNDECHHPLAPMGFFNELLLLRTPTGCIYAFDSISKGVSKSPFTDAWETIKCCESVKDFIWSETMLFLRTRFHTPFCRGGSPPKSYSPVPDAINISESTVESVMADGFIYIAHNSCNGLCYSYRDDCEGVLWIPATGERVKKVAFPAINPAQHSRYYMYDHHRQVIFACLGFDSVSNDYKVIVLVEHEFTADYSHRDQESCDCRFHGNVGIPCVMGGSMSVMLYSLKCDSWKDLPWLRVDLPSKTGGAFYKDGVLHWMGNMCIYAFNFATESILKGTSRLDRGYDQKQHLIEFHGDLGVVAFNIETYSYELWRVKRVGWAWEKQFSFTVDLDIIDEYHDFKRVREESNFKELVDTKLQCNIFFTSMGFFNEMLFLTSRTDWIFIYDSIYKKVIKSPFHDDDAWGALQWWESLRHTPKPVTSSSVVNMDIEAEVIADEENVRKVMELVEEISDDDEENVRKVMELVEWNLLM